MNNNKDIAVVGMACVFPKAANVRQFWSNIVNGVDAIDAPPPGRWTDRRSFQLPSEHEAFLPSNRGGFLPSDLPFDPLPYGVQPNLPRHGDPDQFLMLHIIDAALRDARIAEDSSLRKRTDVIIGRGGYITGKMTELNLRADVLDSVLELLDRRYPEIVGPRRSEMEEYLRSTLTPRREDSVSTAIANLTASRAANRLNLRGAAYTVDGACASSLLAVEQAIGRLRAGQCDAAVAAGVFLCLSPTFLYAFASIGALSSSGTIRPFDRRADGLLAGEGGGAVILKRLDDAIRDGNEIYALVKGAGSASDGREVDVLAPSSSGQVLALENAYADAGIDRDSIGYLELHGTGTVVGDLTELATVKTFFGAEPEPATARAMGSVKSMIGHCMPAAGIAAFIKTALALSNKILPPSLHCEEPRSELADAPFYLITRTRPWMHNPAQGPRRAGVNAFGFGGINAHVVLEEVGTGEWGAGSGEWGVGRKKSRLLSPLPTRQRPIEPGLRRASELLAFSAESPDDMREQLLRLNRFLDSDETEPSLSDLAWTLSRTVQPHHAVKLALIAKDLLHLRLLLQRCLAETMDDDREIYSSTDVCRPAGKIAVLFPGMGFPGLIGNYPDHVLELCLHYPELRAEFDALEDRDRHPQDRVPTSAIFSPPPTLPEEFRRRLKARLAPPKSEDYGADAPAPNERYLASVGVTLSNWISWQLLRKLDIPVDMISGQSQGELAALCAAGCTDFHALGPVFWKSLDIDVRDVVGRQLAFAWVSEEKIAPLLAEEPGAHLAIHGSPNLIVLGGERESLFRIAEKLRQDEILVQMLPYPPIHTPFLSHLHCQLGEILTDEKTEMRKPRIALYSSITSELYPEDAAAIRETLLMNVDHTLHVWRTVRRMYDDGARIFVQAGGGHMATHLHSLFPKGAEIVTAAIDVETRDPLTQLNHLCARLFCSGVPLRLEPLFAHRTVRTLDLDRPQAAPIPSRSAVPLRIDWSPLVGAATVRERLIPPVVARSPDRATAGRPQVSSSWETCGPSQWHGQETMPQQPQQGSQETMPQQGGQTFALPEEAQHMPVLGRVTHFLPQREIVIERTLDLQEDLFLHDHLFVHAECKPLEERLPILPLTMSLEFAAESAALLSPGLGLIGFENVRALRWIGFRDCSRTDLRIESRVQSPSPPTPLPSGERGESLPPLSPLGRGVGGEGGVQRVQCTIFFENQASFTAIALFAEDYRRDITDALVDSGGEGPWPIPVEEIYSQRQMFHGPRFWTIDALHTFGNPGASAALRAMPRDRLFASHPDPLLLTDPCLLDGLGQFVGLWARLHEQFTPLPIGVDKIEFYAPPPPPGTICPVRLEVAAYDADIRQIRFNVEMEDGAGNLCARLQGWSDWLSNCAVRYDEALRHPHCCALSEEMELPGMPEGSACMLALCDYLNGADPEWSARFYLHAREMPQFWEISGNDRRRQFLAERVAVKDAVRVWWARKHGANLPHPAELAIEFDEQGKPFLLSPPSISPHAQGEIEVGVLPHISIAHTASGAAAIAADAAVGVGLEEIESSATRTRTGFVSREERGLLERSPALYTDESMESRLWCAKEAAGKLLGCGREDRLRDLEVIDIDDKGAFLIHHAPTGERLVAFSSGAGGFVLAWAVVAWRGAEKKSLSA